MMNRNKPPRIRSEALPNRNSDQSPPERTGWKSKMPLIRLGRSGGAPNAWEVISHDEESEVQDDGFLEALAQQVKLYSARISAANVDLDIQPNQWRAVGQIWRQVRIMAKISRHDLADAIGVNRHLLTFFENGMTPLDDLPVDFLPKLAEHLGHPELVDLFRELDLVKSGIDEEKWLELLAIGGEEPTSDQW